MKLIKNSLCNDNALITKAELTTNSYSPDKWHSTSTLALEMDLF